MTLKEKIQVVLNQNGEFKCPNEGGSRPATTKATVKAATTATVDHFELLLSNLKQRGQSRPRKLKTLASTIAALFQKKLPETEIQALIRQLETTGRISVSGDNVTYFL